MSGCLKTVVCGVLSQEVRSLVAELLHDNDLFVYWRPELGTSASTSANFKLRNCRSEMDLVMVTAIHPHFKLPVVHLLNPNKVEKVE
ncbi:hypothetical protein O3P69_020534 [Scylla paramamosain]|uniref:Uncharacterized protein n=1 Tax=Scylla paramamosain TaxID=85552 RepID=A0AAW0TLI5_SCYPA